MEKIKKSTKEKSSQRKSLKKKKVNKKGDAKRRAKVSNNFVSILAIVSIVGFLGIIVDSFFEVNIDNYISFIWLIIMGVGFMMIAQPKRLYEDSKKKFEESHLSGLTSFIVGLIAIIAGVLSIPQIDIQHPVFLAIKGVISIIAIIFIIIQTWMIRQ